MARRAVCKGQLPGYPWHFDGERLIRLRESLADLPELVDYLLDFYSRAYSRSVQPLSTQLMRMFREYDWPGNIRELENVIRRLVIFGSEDAIRIELVKNDSKNDINFSADGAISLKKVTRQ